MTALDSVSKELDYELASLHQCEVSPLTNDEAEICGHNLHEMSALVDMVDLVLERAIPLHVILLKKQLEAGLANLLVRKGIEQLSDSTKPCAPTSHFSRRYARNTMPVIFA